MLAKFNSFFFRNKFSSTPTLTAVVVFLLLVAAFLLSLFLLYSYNNKSISLSLCLSVFLSFFLIPPLYYNSDRQFAYEAPPPTPTTTPKSSVSQPLSSPKSSQVPQLYSSLSPKSFGTVLGSSPTHKLCGCMEKKIWSVYISKKLC